MYRSLMRAVTRCFCLTDFQRDFMWKPLKQKRLIRLVCLFSFASLLLCGLVLKVLSVQKERVIQISKVDEEERKRREQQKLEKEQVGLA